MRNSRGAILAITVGFALVFTMLGLASMHMSTLQNETQTKQILSRKAFWLAEAGTAHASWALNNPISNQIRNNLVPIITVNPNIVIPVMQRYYSFSPVNSLELLTKYGGVLPLMPALANNPIDLGDNLWGNLTVTMSVLSDASHPPIYSASTNAYTFFYQYYITSAATLFNITKTINLIDNFSITVQRENFAKYALFTNHQTSSSGDTVWFTATTNFDGPIHTNDRFSFANNPSGHFTGEVTQHETTARFYNNGSPVLLDADSNGNRDVPRFDSGFERGRPAIVIPATTSQQYMKSKVLGGASEPTANGIYLLNNGTSVTGGIFIKGNSTVNMAVNASNNPVYTITRGSITKTIIVNYSNNTTTISGDPKTYSGIPDGQGQTGGGALIYFKNQITGLSGTVQKDSLVTVASEDDLVITNNIRYEKDPTLAGNQNYNNLLGIISWNGDVRIGASAPNNITINGVVMAPNGVFTVDNYDSGNSRGVVTLLGGVITDYYGAFGQFDSRTGAQIHGYGRNFIYDERMLLGDSPLYFPFMPNFTAVSNGIGSGLIWQEG